MRHRVAGRKFNRPTGHRLLMYRTLVTDLLRHERIRTTEPKAKEIRGMAEHMITLGKHAAAFQAQGKPEAALHRRRQAIAFLTDEAVVRKVFDVLALRFASRPGGYTRITKLGPRLGDAAPMAQIELMP
ncbi:MAG: 50S ribosomal protein L17 [Chloroflexi bacterium]|nr:50S ribosomal protein L17 [Chloroflexota bacterium]